MKLYLLSASRPSAGEYQAVVEIDAEDLTINAVPRYAHDTGCLAVNTLQHGTWWCEEVTSDAEVAADWMEFN